MHQRYKLLSFFLSFFLLFIAIVVLLLSSRIASPTFFLQLFFFKANAFALCDLIVIVEYGGI